MTLPLTPPPPVLSPLVAARSSSTPAAPIFDPTPTAAAETTAIDFRRVKACSPRLAAAAGGLLFRRRCLVQNDVLSLRREEEITAVLIRRLPGKWTEAALSDADHGQRAHELVPVSSSGVL